MITIGVVVVLLGIGFIVVAGVFWTLRQHSRIRLRRLRAVVRVSCADLATGHLPPRALVVGTAAPGPDGTRRSPAFDRACIWFSVEVTYDHNDGVVRLTHQVTKGHLGVRDPTGTVLLDPALVLQETASPLLRATLGEGALSPSHRGPSDPPLDRLERAGYIPRSAYGALLRRQVMVEEKIIEPGRPVTVLATPRSLRNNAVLLGRWGATSIEEPDDWIKELANDIADSASFIRSLPIFGLVLCVVGALFVMIGIGPG